MRPITVTVGALASASATNICASQTPSAAFTLNGSTVASGVAVLDTPRRVLFTQAASESGKSYTIIGTTWGGTRQTEVLSAAASATTVYTTLDFLTVTSIAISSAAAGAITVGTNGVASSAWVYFDAWEPPFSAIQCTVTGTANYTVQQTLQDPTSPTNPVLPYLVTWSDSSDTTQVSATTTIISFTTISPVWVKVTLNSGSGSVSGILIQSGGGSGGGGGGGGGGGVVESHATASAPTLSEGSNNPFSSDLHGSQRVLVLDTGGVAVDYTQPVPVSQSGSWDIANINGTVSLPTGASTAAKQPALGTAGTPSADVQTFQGSTASDGAIAAAPVTTGMRGATALPTAVSANGDVVNTMGDLYGRQIVKGALRANKGSQFTTITASTSKTTVVTAVASTLNDLYGLVLANSSASATTVLIEDDSTSRMEFVVPAGETRGFMLPVDSALKQATANKNWSATCGTSVTSLFVTALYVIDA